MIGQSWYQQPESKFKLDLSTPTTVEKSFDWAGFATQLSTRMLDTYKEIELLKIQGKYAEASRLQNQANVMQQQVFQAQKQAPILGGIIPGIPNSILIMMAAGLILFVAFGRGD